VRSSRLKERLNWQEKQDSREENSRRKSVQRSADVAKFESICELVLP
jgi:hypothetical protein